MEGGREGLAPLQSNRKKGEGIDLLHSKKEVNYGGGVSRPVRARKKKRRD